METRTKDPKLFHQLVRNRRSINGNSLLELNVGDNTYTGQNEIIDGFREHFEVLVNPEGGTNQLKDQDYHTNIDFECLLIAEISRGKDIPPATTNELQYAHRFFSSGGTCTLLPSFLGVHPNFWGCNVPSNSSFGGTKKMNCIFSTQGRAPCCFL